MKTIRRLYFYAVAIISMEVVVWGIISLLRSIFSANKITNDASTLAQALALILVGVPIFLVHWLWAQRVSAKDDEEKTASIRAIFFYGILLGTLIPAVQNLLALIDRTFLSVANLYVTRAIVGGSQTWVDNLIAIVVNLLIAAYFWRTLQNEWRTLPETEAFTEIRRLYRFIWMLYGLMMVIYGAQQALDYAFTLSAGNVLGSLGRETAVNAIALLAVGAPIWFFTWKTLQNVLTQSAEQESYLRLGILYLLSLGGVIVVLTAGGNLIYMLLMQVLGEGKKVAEFIQDIGGPISVGVPFAVVWAYYGKWLDQQFAFDEDSPRRAGKKRLYFYILSFLGLAATIFAIISLFSVVIDLIFTRAYLSSSGFASALSTALGALAAGLPLWLLTWRPMQADALAEGSIGDHARRSVIRKIYLYLVLFASVIGGMISGGTLIFTLINSALGGGMVEIAKPALNSLQILVWFVVLLLYHLSALRMDGVATADTLEEKQQEFKLVVLDDGDGRFTESVKTTFAKRVPRLPLTVVNLKDGIPADLKADALVLSGSLAINPPEKSEAWIRSFSGIKLIVEDELAGVAWMNDIGQAADSVKAMAEGQKIRPHSSRGVSAWTYVAYVFAALFALQLLFMLTMLGVSMVTGF
jgi:MFS family permease